MDLSAQISIIATFAALASAFGTMLTLIRLRRAEQASFFLEMTDRYNQPEMQEAINALVLWYKANPANFVEIWIAERNSGKPEALQLEYHRRRIDQPAFHWHR